MNRVAKSLMHHYALDTENKMNQLKCQILHKMLFSLSRRSETTKSPSNSFGQIKINRF